MPVKISSELQEFLKGKQGWVATAAKDGTPNVSIKGSLRLLDDEHLLFSDIFSAKTRKNLQENPRVAIMVYEEQSNRGYIFKGGGGTHEHRAPLRSDGGKHEESDAPDSRSQVRGKGYGGVNPRPIVGTQRREADRLKVDRGLCRNPRLLLAISVCW